MYNDDHEGEILHADGETVKKVMINEASTLLSTVKIFRETSTVSRSRMKTRREMTTL